MFSARRVSDLVATCAHGGPLDGATLRGEAAAGDRRVQIGLWLDGDRVTRARFRATSCPALLACAEQACALAEAGAPPAALGGAALRAAVEGLHPLHHDRADLVALAFARALRAAPHRSAQEPA